MVKDEGHGIPSDILPRIFEPYFTTKKNGHGLGLSTAYTIVRRHHGAITVESEPGRGTTFCVYLPSLGEYVEPVSSVSISKFSAFTPIKSMKGATKAYLGVFRNITEVKKLEEELIKAAKLESIEILAGGIAHDFNNILTIILGNLSLIKAIGSVKGKVLERIEKAEKAALRAKDLTQQLLAFTKGGSPIKRKTSIVNVIEESVTFVSSGSNVKIEVDIQEDIWGVEIDEGQINQVLNNLFINAQQAMPEGGKIWVKAMLRNFVSSLEVNSNSKSTLLFSSSFSMFC